MDILGFLTGGQEESVYVPQIKSYMWLHVGCHCAFEGVPHTSNIHNI